MSLYEPTVTSIPVQRGNPSCREGGRDLVLLVQSQETERSGGSAVWRRTGGVQSHVCALLHTEHESWAQKMISAFSSLTEC